MSESASKVGDLVAEIAAASNEQAQGVDQINNAVVEMDKVVQNNAATAEESASSSEEMIAQAEQMKGMVAELVTLVEGRKNTTGVQSVKPHKRQTSEATASSSHASARTEKATSAPEQMIPFNDDGSFSEF